MPMAQAGILAMAQRGLRGSGGHVATEAQAPPPPAAGSLLTPCLAAQMNVLHPGSRIPSSWAVFLRPGLVSALSFPVKAVLALSWTAHPSLTPATVDQLCGF